MRLSFGSMLVAGCTALQSALSGSHAAPAYTTAGDRHVACSGKLDLDGQWQASLAAEVLGRAISLKGTVPGELITDLQRGGFIADPLQDLNWLEYRTVELYNATGWTYSRDIVVEQPVVDAAPTVYLVFDSIKMGAVVSFNGKRVLALKLPSSTVSFAISGTVDSAHGVPILVQGTAAALYVALTSAAEGRFEPNWFALSAGEKKLVTFIPFQGEVTADVLKSLQDTTRIEHLEEHMSLHSVDGAPAALPCTGASCAVTHVGSSTHTIDAPAPDPRDAALRCMTQLKLFPGVQLHDQSGHSDLANRPNLTSLECAEWACSRDDVAAFYHTTWYGNSASHSNVAGEYPPCTEGNPCCWIKPTFNKTRIHDTSVCLGHHHCMSGVRGHFADLIAHTGEGMGFWRAS